MWVISGLFERARAMDDVLVFPCHHVTISRRGRGGWQSAVFGVRGRIYLCFFFPRPFRPFFLVLHIYSPASPATRTGRRRRRPLSWSFSPDLFILCYLLFRARHLRIWLINFFVRGLRKDVGGRESLEARVIKVCELRMNKKRGKIDVVDIQRPPISAWPVTALFSFFRFIFPFHC